MPYAATVTELADFQQRLVGTWTNKRIKSSQPGGGKIHPFSYNVMPMPQVCAQPGDTDYPGYILKNFAYYETIRFNDPQAVAVPAVAPNRSGRYNQNARALFYDQQVHFAQGPDKDKVVHVENGAWLSLVSAAQPLGPYGGLGTVAGRFPEQKASESIAKQIAVPHGNSVLALGSLDVEAGSPVISGAPVIPQAEAPYPLPAYLSVRPFTETLDDPANFQNPQPALANMPNQPLRDAVGLIAPSHYMHWHVTTEPIGGGPDRGVVTNIPFEDEVAKVVSYTADYWLLSSDPHGEYFPHLAYNQLIIMEMIVGGNRYRFPLTTCNVVTHD